MNGLSMIANAPSAAASAEADSLTSPDISITGTRIRFTRSERRSSTPLVPGISMSLTTQSLSQTDDEFKNTSAAPNTLVE